MVGKAKKFSDEADEAVYQKESNNENFAMGSQQNPYNLGSVHFSDQSGLGNFAQSGNDKRKADLKGSLFRGNIGFNQQTVLLDVPTSTINLNNDAAGAVLDVISTDRIVSLSTGTSANLVTITGAQRPGQTLRLYNISTNTITIKHTAAATANTIVTPTAADLLFPGNAVVTFVYDVSTSKWRVEGNVASGISEPIILGVNTLTPQTSPTATPIAWNTKNPQHITIDRDITFSFTNLPVSGSYEGILVIIDIDSTGGYATPVWPSSVTNPPIISTTANTRTSVMLYTIDGGSVVTNATSSASGSANIALWSNFPALNDVNFATFDGTNIDRLRFVIDSGVPASANDPSIFLDASGDMVLNVADLDGISLKANNVEMAKFVESAASVYKLDMLIHRIDNALDILFDSSAGAITWPSPEPAIGYDSVDTQLKFNVPTASAFQWTVNNTDIMRVTNAAMTFQTNFQIICVPSLTGVAGLNVGGIAGDVLAPANGDIHYNSTTNSFRFYENGAYVGLGGDPKFSDSEFRIQDNADATKQLAFEVSAITTGTTRTITMPDANTALVLDTLSNLGTTAINTSLLFGATGNDIGDTTNPVDQLFTGTVRLQTNLLTANKPTITTLTGNTLDVNFPTGSTFNIHENAVSKHTFSGSSLTSPNIIVSNALTINDSTTNPAANGQFTRNGTTVGLQAVSFDVRRDSTVVSGEPAELKIRKLANSINNGVEIGTLFFQTGISTATTWADIGAGPLVASGSDASFIALRVRADNGLISAATFHGDDNNQRIQMLMGGSSQARIQPVLDRMGYFVTPKATDFTLTIGTAGSLEIPVLTNGSPSLTDLNQAFGAFDGAMGYETVDNRLYVRESSTEWSYWTRDGSVT